MNFFKALIPNVDLGQSPPSRKVSYSQIKELVHKDLIKEAGVDYESRPILISYGCVLPSDLCAEEYDDLLSCIVNRLDQFVENDYVLVFFANPLEQRPAWSWLLKAYRSLGRKYKKNLKKLYIVHPSTLTKFLLKSMSTIVSPKFAVKLVYVATLSQLAALVPFHQLQILEPVYAYNLKFETQLQLPKRDVQLGKVFGRPLNDLMGPRGDRGLPKVVTECIQFLSRPENIAVEGIFRRSPSSNAVLVAKDAYNCELPGTNLEALGGVHVAAALLKVFFRDMPQPLLPSSFYPLFKKIFADCKTSNDQFASIAQSLVISQMDVPKRTLFKHLVQFLHKVHSQSALNLMTAHNLAIVFTPNLIKSANPVEDLVMLAAGSPGFYFVKESILQAQSLNW